MQNNYYAPELLDTLGNFSPKKFLECFINAVSLENLSYPINRSLHEPNLTRYDNPSVPQKKLRFQDNVPSSNPCQPSQSFITSSILNDSTEFEVISSESESDSEIHSSSRRSSSSDPPLVKPISDHLSHPFKRLKLVLDLDNTLLHACARFKLGGCDINLKDFISPNGDCELYRFTLPNLPDHIYYLKLRPDVHQFIKNVSQYCDLAIHTNATQEYAEIVKTVLDPDGRYFGNRLVARNNAFSCDSKKDLDRLFGSSDDFSLDTLLILDDRMDVWDPMYHGNIIHCGMYDYLDSRKQALAAKYSNNKEVSNGDVQLQEAKQSTIINSNQQNNYMNINDEPFSDNPLVELSEKSSNDTENCEDTVTQSSFDDNITIQSNPFLQENALVDYDVELLCISDLIEEIAKQYYSNCEKKNVLPDRKNVVNLLREKRTSILQNTIIQTTGMYKLESSHPEHGWHDNGPVHRKRLLALGATVVQTIIPELTHLLIMRATQTLDMIRTDKSYNVYFVHALWLHACESTWSRIPESWFDAFQLLRLYENNPPKKPWVDLWRVLAQQKDWKYNVLNKGKPTQPPKSCNSITTREVVVKVPSLHGANCWSPFETLNFVHKPKDVPTQDTTTFQSDLVNLPSFYKNCKRRRKVEVAN